MKTVEAEDSLRLSCSSP